MKIGSYGSNGKNNLHFVSFTARSNELKTAIALADLRDDVLDEQNMRILEDGASAILGEDLFPLFSRFERSLREVLTIAQCAAQDAFDDSFVKKIEYSELKEYPNKLFLDYKFKNKVTELNGNVMLSKDELIENISSLDHDNMWNALFDADDMPSFRKNFNELRDRRNDVMHFHRIDTQTYQKTKALLEIIIDEIECCITKMQKDVTYPQRRAKRAEKAAKIANAYDAMVQQDQAACIAATIASFSQWQPLAASMLVHQDALKDLASKIDTSAIKNVANSIAAQSEIFSDNVGLASCVSLLDMHSITAHNISEILAKSLSWSQKKSLEEIKRSAANAALGLDQSKLSSIAVESSQTASITSRLLFPKEEMTESVDQEKAIGSIDDSTSDSLSKEDHDANEDEGL